jgi:hypothetical protein
VLKCSTSFIPVLELSIPQVFPPSTAIFSGIGILLSVRIFLVISVPTYIRDYQAAKYVRASYDALVDIFECIENFLRRLKIYTDIPMTEMVVKIMVEILSVLALATKQINQGRFSMSVVDSIDS